MSPSSPQLLAFGRAIRKARRDLDLSQEALAHLAQISPKHVGEVERARKDPRLSTVLKLAAALGLRGSELLALVEERAELVAETTRV